MATASEQLVGRADELGVLDSALSVVAEGGFAALEVMGEPGLGKTRLLAELGARADAAGHLVLSGSASELEQEQPYWVFVDALDDYLQGLEPRRLEPLGDEAIAQLANVFPTLELPAEAGAPARDDRYRSHRAVRQLLERLALTTPLVLLLDDLHWADSGSVELLGSLLRRPPAGAVLVAAAARPRQLGDRLSGTLERAHADGTAIRLELAALSADESRELLDGSLDAQAATALYEQCGGNPFYLQQLARTPRQGAAQPAGATGVALAGVDVPRTVAAALIEELALLDPDTRRALEGAAVAGDPFEPELAAAAADLLEPAAIGALDELLRRDLVRPTDVPRRFRFRHPLVRAAVYEAAPAGWRLQAHERCAEALASRGAPAAARAHHVERCAREGDLAAVEVLSEAAGAVASRAPVTAARILGAALRLLPSTGFPAERMELLGARAQVQAAAGQFQDAYETLLECLELLPEDPPELRLRVTAGCAGLENLLGHHSRAHERLMSALEGLGEAPSAEGAVLRLELSVDGFYRMEYEAMGDWAGSALETAEALGDRMLAAAAASMLALAEQFRGRAAEARTACDRAADLVDGLDDADLAARIDWAVDTLAASELYLDRLDAAGAHSDRALALAEATGQANVLPILFWAGMIRRERSLIAEGAAIFETAIEIARLSGHSEGLAWNLFGRSLAATAAGESETALACAEEAMEAYGDGEPTFPAMGAGMALAAALVEVDEPPRAADVLLAAGGGEELERVPACWRSAGFEVLTRALLASGRRDEAEAAARRARSLADALGTRHALALAERAAAALALDADAASEAVEHALASAAAAEAIGRTAEAAQAHLLAGRALAAIGQKERAVTELERAADGFDACGAIGRRDQAERELGRLGRRRHRRSRKGHADSSGIEALTERELEVARLIVDRKTNAEIAAELFLSPKTVESHVRHLFQKLGVSSRVEVARTVERAERAAR